MGIRWSLILQKRTGVIRIKKGEGHVVRGAITAGETRGEMTGEMTDVMIEGMEIGTERMGRGEMMIGEVEDENCMMLYVVWYGMLEILTITIICHRTSIICHCMYIRRNQETV